MFIRLLTHARPVLTDTLHVCSCMFSRLLTHARPVLIGYLA